VQDAQHPQPPLGYDPVLSEINFSFKVECPSDFDCKPKCICPPAPRAEPDINYLAKDYASFRQLMLDRMALLSPQWTERNAADLGVALVEAVAFVGDYLSYQPGFKSKSTRILARCLKARESSHASLGNRWFYRMNRESCDRRRPVLRQCTKCRCCSRRTTK
jgi:hypothetical protein